MTEPLRLDKELDLRKPADVEALVDIASTQHQALQMSPDDIRKGINSLARFLPSEPWLKLSPYLGGNLIVPTGSKSRRSFSIDSAAQLGLELESLKDCDGFTDFLVGFTNPPQFFDSVFEAATANYCLPKVNKLKFCPEYVVRGRAKHPDFELTSSYGSVVCECKSASNAERLYVKKFNRLYAAVDASIKDLGIVSNDLRLEVSVHQKLDRDLGLLGREIADAASGIGKANIHEVISVGPCQISLVPRSSPTLFDGRGIHRLSVVVGDRPVRAVAEYAYLHVTTARILKPLIKATGNLIREAKTQLPETQQCVVFIETIDGSSARRAANLRIGTPDYDHILACGISSPDGLQFVHRTSRGKIVAGLFGPFVSSEIGTP